MSGTRIGDRAGLGSDLLGAVATRFGVPVKYVVIFAGVVVALVVGGAWMVLRGGSQDIQGSLVLRDSYSGFDTSESVCRGQNGYTDIEGGAQVQVVDSSGKTLGVGTLSEGQPGPADYTSTHSYTCTFKFAVEGVEDSDFYKLVIGHRDGPTYSDEDLAKADWNMDLSLG